jgi:hypothetical protein
MLCGKEIPKGFQTNKIKCGKAIGGEKECIEYKKNEKQKYPRVTNYLWVFS